MADYTTFSTLSTCERFNHAYYKWQRPSVGVRDFVERVGDGRETLPAVIRVEMTMEARRRAKSRGLWGAGQIFWVSEIRKQRRVILQSSSGYVSVPVDSDLHFTTVEGGTENKLTMRELIEENTLPIETRACFNDSTAEDYKDSQDTDEETPQSSKMSDEHEKKVLLRSHLGQATVLCQYTHLYLVTCAITHHCMAHRLSSLPAFLSGHVKRAKGRADGNKDFWRQHLAMCQAISADMDHAHFHDAAIYTFNAMAKKPKEWTFVCPESCLRSPQASVTAETLEEAHNLADTHANEMASQAHLCEDFSSKVVSSYSVNSMDATTLTSPNLNTTDTSQKGSDVTEYTSTMSVGVGVVSMSKTVSSSSVRNKEQTSIQPEEITPVYSVDSQQTSISTFKIHIPSNRGGKLKSKHKLKSQPCELIGWKNIASSQNLQLATKPDSSPESRKDHLPIFIRKEHSKQTVRRSSVKRKEENFTSLFQYSADIPTDPEETKLETCENILGSEVLNLDDLGTYQLIECLKCLKLDFLTPVFSKHRIDGKLLNLLGAAGLEKHFNIEPSFSITLIEFVTQQIEKNKTHKLNRPLSFYI